MSTHVIVLKSFLILSNMAFSFVDI